MLRNILGLKKCHSTEFAKTKYPVIGLMTEWIKDNLLENNLEIAFFIRLELFISIYSLSLGLRLAATRSDNKLNEIIKQEKKIEVPSIIV